MEIKYALNTKYEYPFIKGSKIQKGCMKLPKILQNQNFLVMCTSIH